MKDECYLDDNGQILSKADEAEIVRPYKYVDQGAADKFANMPVIEGPPRSIMYLEGDLPSEGELPWEKSDTKNTFEVVSDTGIQRTNEGYIQKMRVKRFPADSDFPSNESMISLSDSIEPKFVHPPIPDDARLFFNDKPGAMGSVGKTYGELREEIRQELVSEGEDLVGDEIVKKIRGTIRREYEIRLDSLYRARMELIRENVATSKVYRFFKPFECIWISNGKSPIIELRNGSGHVVSMDYRNLMRLIGEAAEESGKLVQLQYEKECREDDSDSAEMIDRDGRYP